MGGINFSVKVRMFAAPSISAGILDTTITTVPTADGTSILGYSTWLKFLASLKSTYVKWGLIAQVMMYMDFYWQLWGTTFTSGIMQLHDIKYKIEL